MKKVLALILSLALVAVLLPSFGVATLTASADAVNPYSSIVKIHNLTGTVTDKAEVLSCEVASGSITLKVKLGMDDYIQFADPVTDLIDNPGALQVSLEDHEFGTTRAGDSTLASTYNGTSFRIAVTENADYTVTSYITRWLFDGKSWGLVTGYSSNRSYNAASYITSNSMISREIAMSFTFAKDTANGNQIRLDSEYEDSLVESSMLSTYAPAANTPIYVRFVSNKTEQIFNIRLKSSDIQDLSEIVNIYNLTGTVTSNAQILSCKSNGAGTTLKVTLGQDDYIQFAQPMTGADLINAPGALQINLEDHEFGTVPGTGDTDLADAYYNCDFRIELTANSDYTASNVNARWVITAPGVGYTNVGGSNPYIIASAGTRSGGPNAWRYIALRNSLLARGVALSLSFLRDADTGNLRIDSTYSDNNTGADSDNLYTGNYQPTDTDKIYIRIRSNKVQTYNIRLNTYLNAFRIYNTSGTLSSQAEVLDYVREDGSVTAKVRLAHKDYIQFADAIPDLIDNPNVIEINLEDHEFGTTFTSDSNPDLLSAYQHLAMYLQFTGNSDYTAAWSHSAGPSWPLYGNAHLRISGNTPYSTIPIIHTNKNDGWGSANFWKYFARIANMMNRAVAIPLVFHTSGSNIYFESTVEGDGSALNDGTTTDTYAYTGNPLYVRILDYEDYSTYTGHSTVYNIRINSSIYEYPVADYTDVNSAIDNWNNIKVLYLAGTQTAVQTVIDGIDWSLKNVAQDTVDAYVTAINTAIDNGTVISTPFVGAGLTLDENLRLNFVVPKAVVNALDGDPTVTFTTENGDSRVVTKTDKPGDYYYFSYAHIGPNRMGVNITATFNGTFNNGSTFSVTAKTYCIWDYIVDTLRSLDNATVTPAVSALRTVLVDLLNYGSEVQIYHGTDPASVYNTPGGRLHEEDLLFASPDSVFDTDPLGSVRGLSEVVGSTNAAAWSSVTLNLKDSVGIKYTLNTNGGDVTSVKVFEADGVTPITTINADAFTDTEDANKKVIFFNGLTAIQMEKEVKVVAYNGETPVSNALSYSIESYAYSKKDSTTKNLAVLVRSMIKYGRSAEAYRAATVG